MDSTAAKFRGDPDVIPNALLSHTWLFYDNYREYLHNLNKYATNMCFTYLGKTYKLFNLTLKCFAVKNIGTHRFVFPGRERMQLSLTVQAWIIAFVGFF